MSEIEKRKPGQTVINEDFKKQVAAMAATGATQLKIADAMSVDARTIAKTLKMPDVQDMMAEISNDAVVTAKNKLRVKISNLADAVIDALEYQIKKKKSVQAVALALKVMGMDQGEETKGSGNIIVHLPGAKTDEPLTIETKPRSVKTDD